MQKTLLTIFQDAETNKRTVKEVNYEKEFGWNKQEYTAEFINTLGYAIGVKVGMEIKSKRGRRDILRNVYKFMKEVCRAMN